MNTIEIKGLRLYAYHGVMEQENLVGNDYTIDISLKCDLRAAMISDNIEESINYAKIIDIAKDVMSKPSKLLENVIERLYAALVTEFPQVIGGEIRLAKLLPPVRNVQLDYAAVTYSW